MPLSSTARTHKRTSTCSLQERFDRLAPSRYAHREPSKEDDAAVLATGRAVRRARRRAVQRMRDERRRDGRDEEGAEPAGEGERGEEVRGQGGVVAHDGVNDRGVERGPAAGG